MYYPDLLRPKICHYGGVFYCVLSSGSLLREVPLYVNIIALLPEPAAD